MSDDAIQTTYRIFHIFYCFETYAFQTDKLPHVDQYAPKALDIHLFDVNLTDAQSGAESKFEPGSLR